MVSRTRVKKTKIRWRIDRLTHLQWRISKKIIYVSAVTGKRLAVAVDRQKNTRGTVVKNLPNISVDGAVLDLD